MSASLGLAATVLVKDEAVEVHLAPAVLHSSGVFAGNVVLMVRSQPIQPPKLVVNSLWIAVGRDAAWLPPMAYEPFDDGSIEITFHSPSALFQSELPTSLQVRWGQNPGSGLGRLTVSRASPEL